MSELKVKLFTHKACSLPKIDVVFPSTLGADGVNVVMPDGQLLPFVFQIKHGSVLLICVIFQNFP